ncbi:cytochrome P450, partial [Microvirga arabica]
MIMHVLSNIPAGQPPRGSDWAATSPPGPRGLPLLGSLPDLGRDVLGFFTQCARQYGDIVSFRLAAWPAMLLNHPDLVENVLVKNHQNFVKHRFFWRHVRCAPGRGVGVSHRCGGHRQSSVRVRVATPDPQPGDDDDRREN